MNAKSDDETVLDNHADATFPVGDADATLPAGDGDATLPVCAGDVTIPDLEELQEAQNDVALDWKVGDTILGLYEVLPVNEDGDEYHAGGFGKVYKVHHKTWNTDLAVKTPHAEVFQTEAQKQNFISECQAWIELGLHPHIASCYYVRELGGVPRIFAEYVDGGSLKDWVVSGLLYEGSQEESVKHVLDIAIQFAWGLYYAHEQGMIHQDVKPQNVMMTKSGEAKVVDFGLARAKAASGARNDVAAENGGTILVKSGGYTPAYCSPEQQNGKELTRRTDIWSWAVSVLEMFTGERMWADGIVAGIACDDYIADARITVPENAANLLRQCFKENEAERPRTMKEVADTLIQVYEEMSTETYPRDWAEGASDSADSLNNHALSYLDLGEADNAEKLWDKALALDSQHLGSVYNRGLLLWRTGRISDMELMHQLGEIKTGYSDSWLYNYLLGLVHIERSDADSAIEVLGEAVAQSKDNKDVYRALKSAEAGKNTWSKCLRTLSGHESTVNSVTISLDNRYALTGSRDASLKLWDISTGTCLRTFNGHESVVNSVAISADASYALSGSGDETLKLWDLSSGKCLRTLRGHTDDVNSVAISADARYALSGGWDKTMKFWDLSTGKCLHSFKGHLKEINAIAMSADACYALSGDWNGTLRTRNLSSGERLQSFRGHTDRVLSVAVSAEWRCALSGSEDKTLKLWDISTGKCLRNFNGNTEKVNSVAISADGRYALSGGWQKRMKLWDVSTGKCLRTLGEHTDWSNSVAISADGRYAISGSTDTIAKLWKIENSNIMASWHISKPESGSDVITREAQFEKYINQAEQMCRRGNFLDAVKLIKFAKALPGCQRLKQTRDAWAALYRLLPKRRFENNWEILRLIGHKDFVISVAISADNRYALSGSRDKTLKLWDISTGKCLHTFEGHTGWVNSVDISADGRYALSGSYDKTLKLWDTSTGECLGTFKGHEASVESVALCEDMRYALSGSRDETLKLWDISTGKCLRTFKGHEGDLPSATTLSIDGRYVLFRSHNRTLKLWDIFTGECLRTFDGHADWVYSIALREDVRYALSGSRDKTLKLWDVSTGKCLRTFEGHTGWVHSIALSADGRYVLSGSEEGMLKLWDIITGECLRTFEGHTETVESVAISADGRYALSGSQDFTIRIWELMWEVEEKEQADWDDGARLYLQKFLQLHQPDNKRNPLKNKVKPVWTEEEFKKLMTELGYRGYGWLRKEGVRTKLEQMRDNGKY